MLQHLLHLGDGEHVLGQAATQARQFDLRCRVVQDEILPREPAEPTAQRHQAHVLAAETHRLAVALAVVKHVTLVAFEHRPRDLGWFRQSTLGAPR